MSKSVTYVAPRSLPDPVVITICDRLSQELDCEFRPVASVADLFEIATTREFVTDVIVIDVRELAGCQASNFDLINGMTTVLALRNKPVPIMIAVPADCDPVLLRDSLDWPGISSHTPIYSGQYFTYEDVRDSIGRYLRADYSMPPKIQAMLRPRRRIKVDCGITLTPRQVQVLDMITNRGASNKVIARTLRISESTVKLHMSAILKKYGCRNRTQLAVFSRQQDLS